MVALAFDSLEIGSGICRISSGGPISAISVNESKTFKKVDQLNAIKDTFKISYKTVFEEKFHSVVKNYFGDECQLRKDRQPMKIFFWTFLMFSA